MGRPPCCDKVDIKKGPWTPEEDIILVSYIQEHGPGNWKSVPINTGLLRCSKSCRLRWTNYLRPGIKRGNFTAHEEGMIIHLQALLGNRWAAIASYLPQRTDNDIKNYWNTHLKKRMKKFQTALDSSLISNSSTSSQLHSKSHCGMNSTPLVRSCPTYASSTENISRLLDGWMKASPKASDLKKDQEKKQQPNENIIVFGIGTASPQLNQPKVEEEGCGVISHGDLENFFSLENLSSMAWEKSSTAIISQGSLSSLNERISPMTEMKERPANLTAYCFSDKWFFDEESGQVEELMDLSLDCCSASIY